MSLNILRKRRQLIENCPAEAERYVNLFQSDAQDIAREIGGYEGKRVLDVGCGLSCPQVFIFQCLGADVTGIDVGVIEPRAKLKSAFRLAARQGITRTLRDCVVAGVVNQSLSNEISRRMGAGRSLPIPDVREGDALNLAFADNSFDLIYSHAVYEHIRDIGRALDEAARTLKPRAMMRLAIHLYPSLTGGHTGKVGRPGQNVPPWDHLRERRFAPTSYLNELRETQYRKEIESRFDIVQWVVHMREQDNELLTSDIEQELAEKGYPREELLAETLVVHARKPDKLNSM